MEHVNIGYEVHVSQLGMRRFKFYARNGKQFLRDYKRSVKDGLNALDLQKIRNKQLTEDMITMMSDNVYPSNNTEKKNG